MSGGNSALDNVAFDGMRKGRGGRLLVGGLVLCTCGQLRWACSSLLWRLTVAIVVQHGSGYAQHCSYAQYLRRIHYLVLTTLVVGTGGFVIRKRTYVRGVVA